MKTKARIAAASLALVVVATGCGGKSDEPNIMHPPYDASGDAREDGKTPDVADASDENDGCPSGTRLMYKTPGCGANAPVRECVSTAMDPVACPYCDCHGVTQRGEGCNHSPISVPFAAWGSCADAEAGPPDVADASDANDAKCDANWGSCADAAPPDASDVSDASDAGDGKRDADDGDVTDAPCPPWSVVAYNQPGCGINTPPSYCQGPTDSCLAPVCDCNGVTNWSGCGYAQVPFAAWGACPDGGVTDASAD